jgi:hypothetical protein
MLRSTTLDPNTMRLMLYSGLEGHGLAEIFFRNHIVRIFHDWRDSSRRRVDEGGIGR